MGIRILRNGDLQATNCIVSFPSLLEPKAVMKQGRVIGDPRFSAKFIAPPVSPEEDQLIRQALQTAIAKKWPNPPVPVFQVGNENYCVKDPTAEGQEFAGRWCWTGSSKADRPPTVVDRRRVLLTPDRASELFSGCIVTVVGHFYGYQVGPPGVTFQIDTVQVLDNGPNVKRLDNRLGLDEALEGSEDDGPDLGYAPAGGPPPGAPPPAGGGDYLS